VVGEGFRGVFQRSARLPEKIRMLFDASAARMEANGFTKGCPVGAVALDLDDESQELRAVCRRVFDTWREIIATGLDGVPPARRRDVARLILAALEGALILARAEATTEPLLRTGTVLARALGPLTTRRTRARGARSCP
jgi:TetR/AcrR family transcriptional repressor of lmrAB and yxaGH operons